MIIINNALDIAMNELKTIYQDKWLTEQVAVIKNKLNKRIEYLENK